MTVHHEDLIFLVDDDLSMLAILEHFFKKRNFKNLKKFTNGEGCLEQLSLKPSLVVLDHNLSTQEGALNGFDIFKLISQKYPHTHVIITSGQEDGQLVLQMMQHGVRHYVIKDAALMESLEEAITDL